MSRIVDGEDFKVKIYRVPVHGRTIIGSRMVVWECDQIVGKSLLQQGVSLMMFYLTEANLDMLKVNRGDGQESVK